ncbi:hypothetical protein [uncultured Brevundimonas sp.]|uniref:hypothetical protein n=1 Tax=uncultured Brevundimonas sp. TaxID=213418 RepID=UPI0030EF0204|tara:strand:- start:104632 stop:105408 length:777 start_codon:yes stop_codon:yes gene_type:complete
MKWFWGSIWTALLAALSGALIVANEDRIKEAFAPQSVIADVYIGFWQPYPSSRESDPHRLLALRAIEPHQVEYVVKPGERHFARINIRNRGVSDIADARLQTGNRQSDILIVNGEGDGDDRSFFNDVEEVRLPNIPAGGSLDIYMWSFHDMDSLHLLSNLRIFNEDGVFLIKYIRDRDRYSIYSHESASFEFIDGWLPVILFVLLFVGLIGAIIVGGLWEAYVKKLLKDDGFYINEKIRHDENPKAFKPEMGEPPKEV